MNVPINSGIVSVIDSGSNELWISTSRWETDSISLMKRLVPGRMPVAAVRGSSNGSNWSLPFADDGQRHSCVNR